MNTSTVKTSCLFETELISSLVWHELSYYFKFQSFTNKKICLTEILKIPQE